MDRELTKKVVEAAVYASEEPLGIERLVALFDEAEQPGREEIREILDELARECEGRGIELKEVGSGFRFQARQEVSRWVGRLWEERAPKYSRALLETLALVAYRQPITRAEIEEIRGVSVSTNIIRTLQEREWVRVVGHRDVPGRPAMYATTRQFLDYFNLRGLDELPPLAELRDIDKINAELEFGMQASDESNDAEEGAAEHLQAVNDESASTTPEENSVPGGLSAEAAAEEESEPGPGPFDDVDESAASGPVPDRDESVGSEPQEVEPLATRAASSAEDAPPASAGETDEEDSGTADETGTDPAGAV